MALNHLQGDQRPSPIFFTILKKDRDMKNICEDLKNEQQALDDIISDIDDASWDKDTPAKGWAIRDQIAHLAFFDEKAKKTLIDPEGFNAELEEMMKNPLKFLEVMNKPGKDRSVPELKAWWKKERKALVQALLPLDPKQRVAWYGPPMSAKSHATARMMETWAHGQDVADALGVKRQASDRLKHIAHLGYTTFKWSFINHQMPVPEEPVRLELVSPSGELWTWGPESTENRVKGPCDDFCLVVIQRRNVADTRLVVTGNVARKWMSIAQCFAGPGTLGPEPGKFHLG
jgi:uncharacterized protein (TIGR03084 family)